MRLRTLLLSMMLVAIVAEDGRAISLDAACDTPGVATAVVKAAQKLKYPPDAKKLKPNNAVFMRAAETGELICYYALTYANVYDFGSFKVTFALSDRLKLMVKSITPEN